MSEDNNNKDKGKGLLSNNLEMIDYKKSELKKYSMNFKSDVLEFDFQQYFQRQQILTRVYITNSLNEEKRIVYLIFCGICLILVHVLKFKYIQRLNWLINIFTMLVLADCFQESNEKSELRILFNGMALVICFWIQAHNFLFDCICLVLCFIIMHLLKGIDIETGLLTLITLPTILFLKNRSYSSDRLAFLSLKLADLWQDIAKEVSFVQMIIFTFDLQKEKFTYQGSKQSSEQFQQITDDTTLNHLLDNMILDNIIKAPSHQLKDLSRKFGFPLKPTLVKLLNENNWSFHVKSEKSYIAIATYNGYEYKINLRGVNSDDKVYILTLGLNDPESLRSRNEEQLIQQQLLPVTLYNNRKRHIEMQNIMKETIDPQQKMNIMSRTLESMSNQSYVLRNYSNDTIQGLQEDKPEESKKEIEGVKQTQQINSNEIGSSKTQKTDNQESNQLKQNQEIQFQKPVIQIDKQNNLNSSQIQQVQHGEQINNNNSNQSIKKQSFTTLYIPEDQNQETLLFNLTEEIENIQRLYDNQVKVLNTIDEDFLMNTNKKLFRQLLISLFENCYWLQKLENINTQLHFSQMNEESQLDKQFYIELKVFENDKYFYEDKNDQHYQDGKTLYQAICKPFRYLNGNNHTLISSIEFQYLAGYIQTMNKRQINIKQNESNVMICTLWFFADPKKAFLLAEESQRYKNSKNHFEGEEQNNNQIGHSIDYEDIKQEIFTRAFSVSKLNDKSKIKQKYQKNNNKSGDQDQLPKVSPNPHFDGLGGGIIQDNLKIRLQSASIGQKKDPSQFKQNSENQKKLKINGLDQDELDENSIDIEICNIAEYGRESSNNSQIKQVTNYEDKFQTLVKNFNY